MYKIFTFLFFLFSTHFVNAQACGSGGGCIFEGTNFSGGAYQVSFVINDVDIIVNDGGACDDGDGQFNYDIVIDYTIEYCGDVPSGTIWNFLGVFNCSDPNGDGPDSFSFQVPREPESSGNPYNNVLVVNQSQDSTNIGACPTPTTSDLGCTELLVDFEWPGIDLAGVECTQSVLPIKLSSFTAEVNEKDQVELKWTTDSEINNEYFTLEYSKDGENWNVLGRISGQGNSTVSTDYQFIDVFPASTQVYYRLLQTDFDGSSSYSDIVIARVDQIKNDVIAYPNPAQNFVTLQTRENFEVISIVDLYGQEHPIITNTITDREIQLDISTLEPGLYLIKTTQGVTKLTKQ